MSCLRTAVLSSLLPLLLPIVTLAGNECESYSREIPLRSTVSSAAVLANVLRLPSSLISESGKMLSEAEDELPRADRPGDLCPAHCSLPESPRIVFHSAPRKTLVDYDQYGQCEARLNETRERPLLYDDREFANVDKFVSWLKKFTRGNGRDGEDLYERCDGKCSPTYTYRIDRDGEKIVVDTEVVCGHARDRKDDQFDLSSSLLWTCEERATISNAGSTPSP